MGGSLDHRQRPLQVDSLHLSLRAHPCTGSLPGGGMPTPRRSPGSQIGGLGPPLPEDQASRMSAATLMRPGCSSARASSQAGSSTARVPTTTRSAPADSSRSAAASSRTPPPTCTVAGVAVQSASTRARLSPWPSAASRSTTWRVPTLLPPVPGHGQRVREGDPLILRAPPHQLDAAASPGGPRPGPAIMTPPPGGRRAGCPPHPLPLRGPPGGRRLQAPSRPPRSSG